MNWTELKRYASLTDINKFVKYASENKIFDAGQTPSEPCDPDSFFRNISESREHVLNNIMEYDFFDIEQIEELFGKTLTSSQLSNIDILLRITATTMLKKKPEETRLRRCNNADEAENAGIKQKAVDNRIKNEIERTPPQFYYPM